MKNTDLIERQAKKNVEKWGDQDAETLGLAMAEECGEIAQAILQARDEGGARNRIKAEAIDLGALCLQMLRLFPSRRLIVDPQANHLLIALEVDGNETQYSRVETFAQVFRFVSQQYELGTPIDEVRVDDSFRTVETHAFVKKCGWIPDKSIDLVSQCGYLPPIDHERELMRVRANIGPATPKETASARKPSHGGYCG